MKTARRRRQLNFNMVKAVKNKFNNVFISFLIIVILTITSFIVSKINTSSSNVISGVGILYMIVRYAALYTAIVCILLRITNLLKGNSSLLYIFVGTLNICVGVLAIVLFLQGNANLSWLHQCILNIFIGTVILIDVFFINKNPAIDSNISHSRKNT